MRRNYCCSISARGIAWLALSHGSLAWTSLDSHGSQLSWSSLGTAVIWTCVLCGSICVCWPTKRQCSTYLHVSTQHKKSPTSSALQPLTVPIISSNIERHSLAHLSRVSQTIFTTHIHTHIVCVVGNLTIRWPFLYCLYSPSHQYAA